MKTHVTGVLVLALAMTGVLSFDRSLNFKKDVFPRSQEDTKSRIFSGDDADPGEFPFIAGLRFGDISVADSFDWDNTVFYCGGSLISKNIIVTTSICTGPGGNPLEPEKIEAVFGEHQQSAISGTEVVVKFKKIIRHPNFNNITYQHDIALLVLDDESVAELAKHPAIQPIKIAPTSELSAQLDDGAPITLSGFGWTENYTMADTLQKLSYTIVSDERCKEYWNNQYDLDVILDGMLCTGNKEQGTLMTAHGFFDEGYPLFTEVGDDFYQLGVYSWGWYWAQDSYFYDVNTDVPYYYDWLQSQIEENIMEDDDDNDGDGDGDNGESSIWLAGSKDDDSAGVVFVYHPDLGEVKSYAICNDGFGPDEAQAICNHLGFDFGEVSSYRNFAGHKNKEDTVDFGYNHVSCPGGDEKVGDFFSECEMDVYATSDTPCFEGEQVAVQCSEEEFSFTIERFDVKQRYKKRKEVLKTQYKCYPSIEKNGIPRPLEGAVNATYIFSVKLDSDGEMDEESASLVVELKMVGKKYYKGQSLQEMDKEDFEAFAAESETRCTVCVVEMDFTTDGLYAVSFYEDHCAHFQEEAERNQRLFSSRLLQRLKRPK